MKKLLIGAALTLCIATGSALANSSIFANCSQAKHWYSQGCSDIITVYNYASKKCCKCMSVLITVDKHNIQNDKGGNGGDAIVVSCNGYNVTVQPGSSFLCRTNGAVSWHDVGSPCPSASGKYTISY